MAKPDWGELQQRFLSEHAATGVSPKEWCEAQGLNYATARRYIKKTSAQTAQKSAQKKVRIAQKEQSANELMDDDGLTAQQRLFVAEYLKDGNATQAAIRAGYSKKSAEQIGYQLLQKTSVAQAIAQQQKASIARTLGGADEVLAQMWQLATFDANQLSQYRRGACRYCWGFGHQYQWRDMVEFEEKRLEALERKSREPADVGGYGYDHNREPNPACPRCNGDGIGHLLKPRILNGSRVSQLKGRIRFWVPSVAVCSARVKSTWLICSLTKASGSAWNVLSSYQVLEPGNYHFLHALASAGAFLWARPDKIPRGNYVNSKHASEILRT